MYSTLPIVHSTHQCILPPLPIIVHSTYQCILSIAVMSRLTMLLSSLSGQSNAPDTDVPGAQ